jgi:DNA-binding transcriptional ArsR family regulator
MSEILDSHTIKALSLEQRQGIMKMLAKRPYTASEISKATGKHVTTIGQHLDTLERAGLVRKKPGNKWVYYELSDKGEKLFKPQFYSWVVVLSLSVVFMFVGLLKMFRTETFLYGNEMARGTAGTLESAPVVMDNALKAATIPAPAAGNEYVGITLIVIGIIGIAYLAWRKYRG